MTGTIIRPAGPVSPLNYLGSRGELRQLPDGSWVTWDGHDWQAAVLPGAQLDKSYAEKQADGSLQLPNGLWVSGSNAKAGSASSLWVEGPAHVTGAFGVDDNVYAKDVVITPATGSSYSLSSLPKSGTFQTTTTNYTANLVIGTEYYVGCGINWTYDASRKVRIDYKGSGQLSNSTNNSTVGEQRVRIRGGLYSGSVSASDPVFDSSAVPVPIGVTARSTVRGSYLIPKNTWPDGSSVYMGIFMTFIFVTSASSITFNTDTFAGASMIQTDAGP